MFKTPSARIGYSLTFGLALTLATLWLAGGRLSPAAAAGPWFVSPAGNDANGCLSSGNACLTIGEAVSRSASGDVINLAAGTYTEHVVIVGKALTFLGADAATTFVDGSSTGRVFDTDSDLAASDLTIQNGNSAVSDGGGLYATAAVTLTRVNVFSSTTLANGGGINVAGPAVIASGLFWHNSAGQGGGAYLGGTLSLSDTQFISNTAVSWGGGAQAVLAVSVNGGLFQENNAGSSGGGLFADAGLILTGTQFVTNTAGTAFGGGLHVGGPAVLSGATFSGNASDTGGGAEFDGATTIIATTFYSNTATDKGGGAYFNAVADLTNTDFIENLGTGSANGGGAGFGYTATVTGGAFINNTTDLAGGGAYFNGLATVAGANFTGNTVTSNRGGGAYFNGPAFVSGASFNYNQAPANQGGGAYFRASADLAGSYFSYNFSSSRGGGAVFFAAATVSRTVFIANSAGVHGGGVYFQAASQILESVFVSNTAQTGSGGAAFQTGVGSAAIINSLYTRNRSGDVGADLLLNTLGATTLLHTTLADSTPNPGASVFVALGSISVTNTIFANAAAGLVISGGVSASSDYNLFFNAPTNAITGSHSLTGTDPLFVDPGDDNYRLGAGSPAAGAGQNQGVPTDIDGNPRGNPPSIGAYELPTYMLTVSIAGAGSGTVTKTHSQTVYAQGTIVTLTAIPNGGSFFAGWSGDAATLANPITLTLNSNLSVTATFSLTPPPVADLAISVDGVPGQAAPASIVTYTVVVTNTGPAVATTVRLTDTLSVSTTFQSLSSPGGWSCATPAVGATGQIICTTASLAVSAPATFIVTVQLDPALPAAALVTNTAIVTSAIGDPTTPNVGSATTMLYAYRNHWPLIGH